MTDSRKQRFSMGAQFYASGDDAQPWLEGSVVETSLLRPLLRDGILEHCGYVSRNLGEYVKVDSVEALVERSRTWSYDLVLLASDPGDDPDCEINLKLDEYAVSVGLRFGGAIFASIEDRLLDLASGWVVAWSEAIPEPLRLDGGAFGPYMQSYPRPRPPREGVGWSLGDLATYVGIHEHEATADKAALLGRLRTDPLPEGASRRIEGDVLILQFIDSLRDPEAVVRARVANEDWLSRIVPTEPELGWNELGDRVVVPAEPAPRDPLTLYDPGEAVGYKAIVVQPDGTVDPEVWREMQSILRTHALSDGTPVRSLRLIVPRREDALLLHARAIAEGFEMVTYPKGEGAFWEVNPQ